MKDSLSHTPNSFAPHFALFAVQIMFGSFPVVGKLALLSFPSQGIVAFRVGGAALAFFVLQSLRDGMKLECRRDYFRFALYSLLGVVLNQILFTKGLSLTTATNTALLAVTIPVFAALVSTFLGIERLGRRKVIGIAIAAVGVIFLINPAQASFTSATTQGDLLIVINCLCYASYIAISKEAIARNGALKSIAWLFLFGTVICVPIGAVSMSGLDFSAIPTKAWLAIGFVILFPTIGAYYLNAWALARVAPSIVAVYIYMQPLIGFTLAIIFLGEQFTIQALPAALMIFAGVFLVTRKTEKPEQIEHVTYH